MYIAFRTTSLYAFGWLDALGLNGAVSSTRLWVGANLPLSFGWLIGSAPAGLWAFSGALAMRFIWWGNRSVQARLWFIAVPVFGLASELGQLAGVPGTFDVGDLAAYTVGTLIAVLLAICLEASA